MAGLCEGGNEPPGSLKASDFGYSCVPFRRPFKIMERSSCHEVTLELKRSPNDSDVLKKAVEAVIASPGNKISIREACSGL
ncbi:hypothetical protein ANN_20952 [Periplaneta americana]|uniref:Uncharacterized protein n=1 Tax=Periplaneta americana TaxID=6978 RepID=A0ABQ8SEB9_PERAM|nr:hypothetical protein ANN_20952 [Periplaneta americana]